MSKYRNRKGQFRTKPVRVVTWMDKVFVGGIFLTVVLTIAHDKYAQAAAPIIYVAPAEVQETHVLIEAKKTWTKDTIEQEIRRVFNETPNTAVAVAKCESGLVADIVGPTSDHGVFQVHAPTWDKVANELGYINYKTDPEDNIAMARYIYDQSGWDAWVCHSNGWWKNYL